MRCPLCGDASSFFALVRGVRYHHSPTCDLVFMDPAHRPDPSAERARYELHRNDPSDDRYRAFLDRLALPLVERIPERARGLDYGCGPGPTLSVMFRERGFEMAEYDPFFAPGLEPLRRSYDFISCSETAEHFFEPRKEFERLDGLLRPGGWLGVMTGVRDEAADFARWWYVRDPTHVSFYAPETFRWIAVWRGWSLERPAPDVALFRKPR